MNYEEFIGQRIKEIRLKKGLFQKDLAEKTGLRQENIVRIEKGRHSVRINTLGKIADALGVRIDFIEDHASTASENAETLSDHDFFKE